MADLNHTQRTTHISVNDKMGINGYSSNRTNANVGMRNGVLAEGESTGQRKSHLFCCWMYIAATATIGSSYYIGSCFGIVGIDAEINSAIANNCYSRNNSVTRAIITVFVIAARLASAATAVVIRNFVICNFDSFQQCIICCWFCYLDSLGRLMVRGKKPSGTLALPISGMFNGTVADINAAFAKGGCTGASLIKLSPIRLEL
ncbi:hypothetical protein BX661DRAFT_206976 [Kickxella alabastrina]|uniref:uncharacterized protein n=1 Tax=Kickxella alabastrina TaxID=61397 RepID=UPI0022207EAA|nr:uncharacterized protein BX661DRAFT_206976 [Kickxella alabastrina]KAI7823718.1 hypothetical protein BX661DRAFT_206976 [Kickxella alabastrina]